MFTLTYNLDLERGSVDQDFAETNLDVEFRFGKEVLQGDIREVEKRYYPPKKHLDAYLEKKEGLKKIQGRQYYSDGQGKRLYLYPCWFRLGFNVNVIAEKNLPLEEMLDVDSLNRFVLTGNISQ
jgi:hypothetical protein